MDTLREAFSDNLVLFCDIAHDMGDVGLETLFWLEYELIGF